jgi:hypothetical protein
LAYASQQFCTRDRLSVRHGRLGCCWAEVQASSIRPAGSAESPA